MFRTTTGITQPSHASTNHFNPQRTQPLPTTALSVFIVTTNSIAAIVRSIKGWRQFPHRARPFPKCTPLFTVTRTIFGEGLNKDTLFQRMDQVRDGILFTLWTLQSKAARPPHDTWYDNLNVH